MRQISLWLARPGRWYSAVAAALWLVVIGGAALRFWSVKPSTVSSLVAIAIALLILSQWAMYRREQFIRNAALPQFLKLKLREHHPHLSQKDAELVERGLRQFFLTCHRSQGKFVAMPSKAVDAMWHEFILHTRAYRRWCGFGLGRFLHHTPAEALAQNAKRNDGLRRAWYWACKDESIDPRLPTRLPLLFALDTKLNIEGGFRYVPDCRAMDRHLEGNGATHCGTDFSGGSANGDGDGFGGADGGSDGDGGGCGGD
jgi:hypothetical protein